ncbi:MAG: hypothetical protein ACRDVM_01440 [Acidimicrobiia bacterium]
MTKGEVKAQRENRVELLRHALADLRERLTAERESVSHLRARRRKMLLDGNGHRPTLEELDVQISKGERNIEDLETIWAGLDVRIAHFREAERRIRDLELELQESRDQLAAFSEIAAICSILGEEVLGRAKRAQRLSHGRAGYSVAELITLIEGRWSGRLRTQAASMIAGRREKIPRLEAALADAWSELAAVAEEVL